MSPFDACFGGRTPPDTWEERRQTSVACTIRLSPPSAKQDRRPPRSANRGGRVPARARER